MTANSFTVDEHKLVCDVFGSEKSLDLGLISLAFFIVLIQI